MWSFVGGPRDGIGAFVAWPGPPDTGEGIGGSAGSIRPGIVKTATRSRSKKDRFFFCLSPALRNEKGKGASGRYKQRIRACDTAFERGRDGLQCYGGDAAARV